jgi:hypothetical protein
VGALVIQVERRVALATGGGLSVVKVCLGGDFWRIGVVFSLFGLVDVSGADGESREKADGFVPPWTSRLGVLEVTPSVRMLSVE